MCERASPSPRPARILARSLTASNTSTALRWSQRRSRRTSRRRHRGESAHRTPHPLGSRRSLAPGRLRQCRRIAHGAYLRPTQRTGYLYGPRRRARPSDPAVPCRVVCAVARSRDIGSPDGRRRRQGSSRHSSRESAPPGWNRHQPRGSPLRSGRNGDGICRLTRRT